MYKKKLNSYDKSVKSLKDADHYDLSGESEYSRERSDPYQMVDYLIDRGLEFRGNNPKEYTLNDNRILENVCEKLTRDINIDANQIFVVVENGCVYLTGHVDSRQTKQLAELTVEGLPGVNDIINILDFDTGTRHAI